MNVHLDHIRSAFDAKAQAWDDYTHTPIGRLREELTLHYLSRHLPDAAHTLVALDAGGGTGALAIALRQHGFHVHLLDLAPEMLSIARSHARNIDPIEYHCAPIAEVQSLFEPESFDLITCHTLIEYVSDPATTLRQLASLLKPRAMFSLQFVNRHADALRLAVAKGQFAEALAALGGNTSQADLFGVPRRTFDRDEAQAMLRASAIKPIAEYGVRIFADYLSDSRWQTDDVAYAALIELEQAAAALEPYRAIARYGLIIGIKS